MHDGIAVLPGIPGDRLQTVDAQNNIFQRKLVGADLCVLHIGVDGDNIACRNGNALAGKLQIAASAGNKKELGAGMGVQRGMPLGAVARRTDVEQPGDRTVYRIGGERIKNIAAGTHTKNSFSIGDLLKNAYIWEGQGLSPFMSRLMRVRIFCSWHHYMSKCMDRQETIADFNGM
ncbi:hypothetical protein BRYFOR_05611 [Marvinbryantia formatexigens DSM 14469]|uniref:Uncharacterized protein n=1 Tax=Marvinbryantia formatexigens DSM 14469 TaxID=478749 RepID=C6LAG8_9FIRM|nr:hypothetical protein BRYFOR_05611 [Marvinbryantia formatexigens DSM 14469]